MVLTYWKWHYFDELILHKYIIKKSKEFVSYHKSATGSQVPQQFHSEGSSPHSSQIDDHPKKLFSINWFSSLHCPERVTQVKRIYSWKAWNERMKVGGEITLSVPFTSEYNLISKWGYPEYGSPYQLIEWKYTLSGTCCRWINEFIKSENLRRGSTSARRSPER